MAGTDLVQVAKAATPEMQEYDQADLDNMQRILGAAGARPDLLPVTFLAYLQDYFSSADPLQLTTNSLLDFAKFTPNLSAVVGAGTFEQTSSTSYTDLTTPGPEIDNLPNGYYIIMCCAGVDSTLDFGGNTGRACMGPSVNGSTPSDQDAAYTESSKIVRTIGISAHKLQVAGGSNTIVAKYKIITGSTAKGEFTDRMLVAIRYANL